MRFAVYLREVPKLIGIDYGTKRVGVAVTDESGSVAFPKATIPNTPALISRISDLVAGENPEAIVLGESKKPSGEDNPVMKDVRSFAEALKEATKLPIHFEPEFYSSVEARRDTGGSHVDAEAAAIILNSFITRSRES